MDGAVTLSDDRVLGAIAQAQAAPVPTPNHDRHRKVMHQLAGIATVGLQEQPAFMAAAAPSGAIVEQTLAATLDPVHLRIARGWRAEGTVMGRHVAFRRGGDGVDQRFVLRQ